MAVDDLLEAAADEAILMKTSESGSPTNDTRPAAGYFRSGLRLQSHWGDRDPVVTPALLVARPPPGIPNARLICYPGMGHPASGKQFKQDVLAFLRERSR